mmetsp:Transcript_52760/g.101856  ORF Transcript_52760/g.101856 Transcript_52760/m.101856 type:complete len:254 (-) Transcript_52760:195-956(-)
MSNAPRLVSSNAGTIPLTDATTGADSLKDRMRCHTSTTCSASTKSSLLSKILSAKESWRCLSMSSEPPANSLRRSRIVFVSTSVMVPSSLKCFAMSGVWRNVLTMGTGSAIPVVSTNTASSGLPCSICFRIESKAPRRSPRTVQHIQPFSMTTTCSARPIAALGSKSWSMGTAPNSFSMIANFLSRCPSRRWFNTVVLPAPRNPVKIVTGTGSLALRSLSSAPPSDVGNEAIARASPKTTARSPSAKWLLASS